MNKKTQITASDRELLEGIADAGATGITPQGFVSQAAAVGLTLSEETILTRARTLRSLGFISIAGEPIRFKVTTAGNQFLGRE